MPILYTLVGQVLTGMVNWLGLVVYFVGSRHHSKLNAPNAGSKSKNL